MKNTNKLEVLSGLPFFTPSAFASIANTDHNTAKTTISRLAKQNKIIKLKNGHYMSRDFVLRYSDKSYFPNLVSNIIHPFSYLSLTYILQKHNILTEAVYPITSITIKNTSSIRNKFGNFEYSHIKQSLYTGFVTEEHHSIKCNFATKSKALFDFLYLRPLPIQRQTKNYNLAEDLRLNLDEFSQTEKQEFEKYCLGSPSPKMTYIVKNIKKHIWQPF